MSHARGAPESTLVLDVVRHGEAESAAHGGDEARALTARGRADLARLGAELASQGARYTHAFASPLARARESAAILRAALSGCPAIATLSELLPEREPESVLVALAASGIEAGHVLLVAHQPLVGRLIEWLDGVDTLVPPATLFRLACKPGPGRLRGQIEWTWVAAPGRPRE
jgi:phosphohistidine phosphatase SixA